MNGLPAIDFPSKKTIKESLGLKESNIVIGNNARLSFQKDPFLFMEVAKEVIQQDPNYHFVWAGDGPLFKEVKAFLIKHDLTGNVHLLGERTDSERIVAGYDHYLITSRYEGLPYSLIEAIRAGVPIIGKKVTGVEEIIEQTGGCLLNTDSPHSFARAILNAEHSCDKQQIIAIYQKIIH